MELADLTFNGPSDTYTNAEAASINAISDNDISCDGEINTPHNFGFSPDMVDEYDIHVDAVAYTRAINKFEAEYFHKLSIGSVSSNTSNAISESLPFVEEQSNDLMDLGMNPYSANVSTTAM